MALRCTARGSDNTGYRFHAAPTISQAFSREIRAIDVRTSSMFSRAREIGGHTRLRCTIRVPESDDGNSTSKSIVVWFRVVTRRAKKR
jgi:hypothetical protein